MVGGYTRRKHKAMILAIDGGTPEVRGQLAPFNTIGREEIAAATTAIESGVLSGFIGGELRGGKHVRALEDAWCETFGVRHAVACNSATSALLAACAAVGVEHGDDVVTTPFTMSATAAAPRLLGANITFTDIEEDFFCIGKGHDVIPKVLIASNIFGQPTSIGRLSDISGVLTIEDNAQAPFAMNHGKYAGTIADIGCWSLNVHKHFQSGEGGVCTTDDDALAQELRHFINHGEMAGSRVGLNLRMTEVTAAIALAQLRKAKAIMVDRVDLAESLTRSVRGLPGLTPPVVRSGCMHSYYLWALKVSRDRDWFVRAMKAEGVPLYAGYVPPLYRLPAFSQFARPCPVAERMHDRELALFEVCAHAPTAAQITQIGNAFQKVAENMRG